jgi:serine/threonine protein kinase/WD40 repeat protein
MRSQGCVSDADLRAFALGELPDDTADRVAEHIESCLACESAAARLDGLSDPIMQSLRRAVRTGSALPSAPETVPPCGVITKVNGTAMPKLADYEVLAELGRGGMGIVYRARDRRLGRVVALKLVKGGADADGELRERFRREAAAMAQLQHPGIVQIFEVGEEDGTPFLAMELVAGASLATHLNTAPLAARPAAELLRRVAEAVAFAHQHGVLHRDLTPANVLLQIADCRLQTENSGVGVPQSAIANLQSAIPKITDFGLARLLNDPACKTQTGAIIGTPNYLSPEQADGKGRAAGPVADVYALGAILYECLTGRPPFRAATVLETLAQVVHDEPVAPSQLLPQTPHDLGTICLKCLRKEPAQRYAGAQALADDLGRFLAGRPVLARPVGTAERLWRWARRNPGWAATGLGIAVLLAVFAAVQSITILNLNVALKQSEDERVRTSAAELAGKYRLWEAYLAQAQASRFSGRPGQRFASLTAIRKALALPTPPDHTLDELRNEAIACIVLADVQPALDQPTIPQPAGEGCLAPDVAHGRYATVGKDRVVHLRHWPDGREIMRLENSGSLDAPCIMFSPDGRFLAHASGWPTRAKLWRLDGAAPAVVVEHACQGVDFLPAFRADSRQFAIGCVDFGIYLYATATGTLDRRLHAGLKAHLLAYCPTQRWLAVAGGTCLSIVILDIDTGQRVSEIRLPEPATALAWDPSGCVMAAGCANQLIYFWDCAHGRWLRPPLEGHTAHICDIGFNHAGDRFASLDWDFTLRLWEVQAGRLLVTTTCSRLTPVSPDDAYLLGDTVQEGAALLRIANARELRTQLVSNHSRKRAFGGAIASPDGRLLAASAGDDTILIDWAHGVEVAEIRSTHPCAFTRDGALLTSRWSRPIERWPVHSDPASGIVHVGPPTTVYPTSSQDIHGTSSDGTVVAIPARSHALVVHASGEQKTFKGEDVRTCTVSPDGRWVATGDHFSNSGFGAAVWDAQSGQRLQRLPVGHTCRVCFSPDGRWLLTTGGGYRLWHTESWQEGPHIAQQPGENGAFPGYAFSPDSKLVALSAGSGRIRLVKVETGRELAVLSVPEKTHLQPAAFAPDGAWLAAIGSGNRMLYTWDLRAIREQLRDLSLDWEASAYPPPRTLAPPMRVQIDIAH